jgi:hypothetical protein
MQEKLKNTKNKYIKNDKRYCINEKYLIVCFQTKTERGMDMKITGDDFKGVKFDPKNMADFKMQTLKILAEKGVSRGISRTKRRPIFCAWPNPTNAFLFKRSQKRKNRF